MKHNIHSKNKCSLLCGQSVFGYGKEKKVFHEGLSLAFNKFAFLCSFPFSNLFFPLPVNEGANSASFFGQQSGFLRSQVLNNADFLSFLLTGKASLLLSQRCRFFY